MQDMHVDLIGVKAVQRFRCIAYGSAGPLIARERLSIRQNDQRTQAVVSS